ncbi:GNAT family protein [Glutamicibacter protophormiae]|nr:GNAT family protein [Glutamicibacter protophormiae]WPR65611.1 GNAT family protein [Glutamicibacter protophormiae]WPR69109.1 GNAT family protein [Glutamicibacter protophormiae]
MRLRFQKLGLLRIFLKVAAINSRAIRAYEKSGFILEGRERGAYFHDGKFHDQLLYGLLADEYFSAGA